MTLSAVPFHIAASPFLRRKPSAMLTPCLASLLDHVVARDGRRGRGWCSTMAREKRSSPPREASGSRMLRRARTWWRLSPRTTCTTPCAWRCVCVCEILCGVHCPRSVVTCVGEWLNLCIGCLCLGVQDQALGGGCLSGLPVQRPARGGVGRRPCQMSLNVAICACV